MTVRFNLSIVMFYVTMFIPESVITLNYHSFLVIQVIIVLSRRPISLNMKWKLPRDGNVFIENATVARKNKKLPFHEYGSEMNLFFICFCLFVCFDNIAHNLHARNLDDSTVSFRNDNLWIDFGIVQREDLYFTHAKGLKCDQNVAMDCCFLTDTCWYETRAYVP